MTSQTLHQIDSPSNSQDKPFEQLALEAVLSRLDVLEQAPAIDNLTRMQAIDELTRMVAFSEQQLRSARKRKKQATLELDRLAYELARDINTLAPDQPPITAAWVITYLDAIGTAARERIAELEPAP